MTLLYSRFTSGKESIVFGDRHWASGDKGGQLLNASYWSHGNVKRLDPKSTQPDFKRNGMHRYMPFLRLSQGLN